MKANKTYRFITFILIGLLSVAFSQSFAKITKVEKAKQEQSKEHEKQGEDKAEHVLETYEAVISVDQNVINNDNCFLPTNEFPCELATELINTEQLTVSVLSYFEVLFETSICTNAP